ncbi:putative bifunctional diguanylate cyclase/phosphodiesterase [Desulfogranum japonicum]|uniref:putative bifunctional diguanylate cyclase/phosphodiesterase n=1 Tax=Desulfogranum japonicum TaxID=231447 RepID=UPI0004277505|nr:EAL domain-containing protein [Desulfogranum japonicum]
MLKNASFEKKILAEQVESLYAKSPSALLISVIISVLICWPKYKSLSSLLLVSWLGLFQLITLGRFFLTLAYRRNSPVAEPIVWYRRFLIGTAAAASMWASTSFIFLPPQFDADMVVFMLLQTGLVAGAVTWLSSNLKALLIFQTLILLPLALKLVLVATPHALFMALLTVIFYISTYVSSHSINQNMRENIELKIISEERERTMRVSEERYRHLFNHAPLGLFQYDSNAVVVDCNETLAHMLNAGKTEIIGINMFTGISQQGMLNAVKDSLRKGDGYFEGEYTSILSRKKLPIRVIMKAITGRNGKIRGGMGIIEDLTERKISEAQIQYHTTYDTLTGLPNRRLLLHNLENEITRAERYHSFGALLFIDLDNFKTINDSLGHSAGDALLKLVADRIQENIRNEDTASRMGGDEFILILTELGATATAAASNAKLIAEKLSSKLSLPCRIEGHDIHITPSIGVSIFPKADAQSEDILKQADTAMYKAKASGRNEIRFFMPSMQDAADKRLRLNMEIRNALKAEEFALHYQPQVTIDGSLVGGEALLRWIHPERGQIPPSDFLPIAEEKGMQSEIDQWVFRTACTQVKHWHELGIIKKNQFFTVNISSKEFSSPYLLETIERILQETKAPAYHLGLEITEGGIISTDFTNVQKIMALRELGMKVSLDDFGTGYSSLGYLNKLPLSTLKIDRSFVQEIGKQGQRAVLVDSIIMLAQNLGMDVIAEGVEREQEVVYLYEQGCNIYQGYLFSKPVPAMTFAHILKHGLTSSSA